MEGIDLNSVGKKLADEIEPVFEKDKGYYEDLLQPPEPLSVLTPQEIEQMRRQAYREIYVLPYPAKLMLETAEKVNDAVEEPERYAPYKITQAAKIELIEAYGVVEPLEGYRILSGLDPSYGGHVEALAKFARLPNGIVDSIFVDRAREEAERLTVSRTLDGIEAYELIAKLGTDPASAKRAIELVISAGLQSNSSFNKVNTQILTIAATGYLPAIGQVKERILLATGSHNGLNKNSQIADETAAVAAQAMALEKYFENNPDELYCADDYSWEGIGLQDKAQNQWVALVTLNEQPIFEAMRNLPLLPEIPDYFSKAVAQVAKECDYRAPYFADDGDFGSSITSATLVEWVDAKTVEFYTQIARNGADEVARAAAWIKKGDYLRKFNKTKSELEQGYKRLKESKGYSTIDTYYLWRQQFKSEGEAFAAHERAKKGKVESIVVPLTQLALIRAAKQAAIALGPIL